MIRFNGLFFSISFSTELEIWLCIKYWPNNMHSAFVSLLALDKTKSAWLVGPTFHPFPISTWDHYSPFSSGSVWGSCYLYCDCLSSFCLLLDHQERRHLNQCSSSLVQSSWCPLSLYKRTLPTANWTFIKFPFCLSMHILWQNGPCVSENYSM